MIPSYVKLAINENTVTDVDYTRIDFAKLNFVPCQYYSDNDRFYRY